WPLPSARRPSSATPPRGSRRRSPAAAARPNRRCSARSWPSWASTASPSPTTSPTPAPSPCATTTSTATGGFCRTAGSGADRQGPDASDPLPARPGRQRNRISGCPVASTPLPGDVFDRVLLGRTLEIRGGLHGGILGLGDARLLFLLLERRPGAPLGL